MKTRDQLPLVVWKRALTSVDPDGLVTSTLAELFRHPFPDSVNFWPFTSAGAVTEKAGADFTTVVAVVVVAGFTVVVVVAATIVVVVVGATVVVVVGGRTTGTGLASITVPVDVEVPQGT